MTVLEYLSVVRRRWLYVAVGVVAGALAGFLTAPGRAEAPRYQGTHTLLVDDSSPAGAQLNLEQSALLATTGPVPLRVAEQLVAEGLPAPDAVAASADPDLRSLAITATAVTADAAARAADLTAEAINAELVRGDRAAYEAELEQLAQRATEIEAQQAALDAQLAGLAADDPARGDLAAQRSAAAGSLAEVTARAQALRAGGPPAPPLTSLEAAIGAPADEGWQLPGSRAGRGVILGLVGLVLGLAGALAADRLDTRIRGKVDAERAFDLPVIAEIPPLGGAQRGRELLVATRPASPFVEAYRALRTVVLFAATEIVGEPAEPGGAAATTTNGTAPPQAKVVLVTSPAAGEGKTTTAAHLAAVLAEGDRRVLVISADFRRPRIHEYFDVPREPGLSDVLDPGAGRVRLSDLQMATSFAQVHLLPSGRPVDNPAQLLTESTHLLRAARPLFDFIVVDTPPLLVANDATELAAVADLVVLVAKADRTSRDAARRATELLRRVDAPLLGVVVAAAHDTPTAYGYYRYRYYAEADQGKGGRRPRKDRAEPAPVAAMAGEAARVDQP